MFLRSCSFLLFLSIVSGDSSVLNLDSAGFAEQIASKNTFIKFYAPWCGFCKKIAPTWDELAEKYNSGSDVTIAKVDCTVETELCSKHEIKGYPTIKFFKSVKDNNDVDIREFDGQRTLEDFVKFINKILSGDSVEEATAGEATVENGLYVLSKESFKSHISSGEHFIKFYAPWCGHCKKLAPTWGDLGKAFEHHAKVKIGKLDCTEAQSVCQGQDVKGYPTLAYYKDGKKVETYKGARSLDDLKDFVSSMAGEESKKDSAKESVKGDEDVAVKQVTSDDFQDSIKQGLTFVKFFAPWCGHCKRLAPTWGQLALEFKEVEGVTIGKVDCTSDDNKNKDLCNSEGVNGFPTLTLYKDGKKLDEYKGSRKFEDLQKYIQKHLKGEKDEL